MRYILPAFLVISQLINSQVLINEYSAANYSDFQDTLMNMKIGLKFLIQETNH